MSETPDHSETPDYDADARKIAKILRDGSYSYRQTKEVFKRARRALGLKPPPSTGGSVDRLSTDEIDRIISAAYDHSSRRGVMIRTLLETGIRVGSFAALQAEDLALGDREIIVPSAKGGKRRDVPITSSLAQTLRVYLQDRETGYLWPSRQGGHLSRRRIQQIVKATAADAGITKRVYPHKLRHTIAQRLADEGMPVDHLQRFLGHERIETTRLYYETNRSGVRKSFEDAMST